MSGATRFEVASRDQIATLRLLEPTPASVAFISVRFKKGQDAWELSSDGKPKRVSPLVPGGELNRAEDAPPEWVLFTLRDADGNVVEVGGTMIP